MGNSLGRRKSAKVMKINGETLKLRTPVRAGSVLLDHPGHVLLESESVRHYGVRSKPLDPAHELKPNRLYFLVELPKIPEDRTARRVRSGIQMSAKDRLESLMLARRSSSDLSIMKLGFEEERERSASVNGGGVRVRMRLPKAEVERIMAESKDEKEVAEKMKKIYMAGNGDGDTEEVRRREAVGAVKRREKRVGFLPIHEGEIQLAVS